MKKLITTLFAVAALLPANISARTFTHPGALYTQSDLDRMRAAVEAHQEPYYSAFLKLKSSGYSQFVDRNRGTSIAEGKFNQTVGDDGRRAHDMALLWHLTGDKTYADNVVKILNFNSYYTNTSARGTAPLDNGKIFLLLQAAELMRDYPGWLEADKQRFKDMLVYPGYSSSAVPNDHISLDDSLNDVTFYWNIYNFDAARFGNQGLFAARAMMAMGIFLDNEKIYDRAYRYLMGLPHRSDDLPYVSGPPTTASKPYDLDKNNPEAGDRTTSYMLGYELKGRSNWVEDYGYDEQLRYYIYTNGQSQEACRDQDHAQIGPGLYTDIAEMAWNQGDNMYGALDNRILSGWEWTLRYNFSYEFNPANAWEPAGYTKNEADLLKNPELFYQVRSRSGRWESVAPSKKGRGDSLGAGGNRECALAHYAVRFGLPQDNYYWTLAARDHMISKYGYEDYGKDYNHSYEWAGWGTLTKRREANMAGDPGTWIDGAFNPSLHTVDSKIRFADYDRFAISESGHTSSGSYSNAYRDDAPGLDIDYAEDSPVKVNAGANDWMIHTLYIPEEDYYDINVNYTLEPDARPLTAGASVSGANTSGAEVSKAAVSEPAASETTTQIKFDINGESKTLDLADNNNVATAKQLYLPAGVYALKTSVPATSGALALNSFELVKSSKNITSSLGIAEEDGIIVDGHKVSVPHGCKARAYDLTGRLAASAADSDMLLAPGTYIITIDNRAYKLAVK